MTVPKDAISSRYEPNADTRPLDTLLDDLGRKLEAYRISRRLRQVDLAERAGVSVATVKRLESGAGGTVDSLARVLRALDLDDRLMMLVPEAGPSPLDPRSDRGPPRKRVRLPVEPELPTDDSGGWTWGEE